MLCQCSKGVKIAQTITDQRAWHNALEEILEQLMCNVIHKIFKDRNSIYSNENEPEMPPLGSPVVQKEQIFQANSWSQDRKSTLYAF